MEPATVTTALTLVSTGASVAKLFGPGGSSVARMQRIQMELLVNISKQVAVIQRGVDLILRRLGDIEMLIGQIPSQTVTEEYRQRGYGLASLFQEHMKGYVIEREASTIERAQEVYVPLLEREVLAPMREVRSILMLQDEPALIPAVSTMLHAEVHAMIVANYEKSRMVTALQAYEQWLRAESSRFRELCQSARKLGFKRLCVQQSGTERFGHNGRTHEYKWGAFQHLIVEYTLESALTADQMHELTPIIPEVLAPDLSPLKLQQRVKRERFVVEAGSGRSHSQRPDLVTPGALIAVLKKTPACSPEIERHADAARISKELERSGFGLVALAGLFVAGRAALNAVTEFGRFLPDA